MWIEISAPGDRRLRMNHASVEDLKGKLEPGYSIIGTVSLCNDKGEGGFVSPLNGPSLMGALLEAHGEELLAWLNAKRPDPVTLNLDTSEISRMVKEKLDEFTKP